MKNSLSLAHSGIYVVGEGETVKGVAEKFCSTEEIIISENNLSKELQFGDVIYVSRFSRCYVVKVGDSESDVLLALNVSKEELYSVNKVNYIFPYMRLVAGKIE